MTHVKKAGLLVVAATALMAFAGTASATILTSPAGTTYTGEIKAEAGTTTLAGSFTTVDCKKSTAAGKVESHGAATTTQGVVTVLTFTECNHPVTVNKKGSLELHTFESTVDGNGTLTSIGAEITVKTSIGTCIFTTNSTDIGTVLGGTPAKLKVENEAIPRTGGSAGFLCGSTGIWNGSYTVTTPGTLLVD
ncbi:MAG TPA: hypothetical protein VIV13_06550 [Solirubrobacterales bacterium]